MIIARNPQIKPQKSFFFLCALFIIFALIKAEEDIYLSSDDPQMKVSAEFTKDQTYEYKMMISDFKQDQDLFLMSYEDISCGIASIDIQNIRHLHNINCHQQNISFCKIEFKGKIKGSIEFKIQFRCQSELCQIKSYFSINPPLYLSCKKFFIKIVYFYEFKGNDYYSTMQIPVGVLRLSSQIFEDQTENLFIFQIQSEVFDIIYYQQDVECLQIKEEIEFFPYFIVSQICQKQEFIEFIIQINDFSTHYLSIKVFQKDEDYFKISAQQNKKIEIQGDKFVRVQTVSSCKINQRGYFLTLYPDIEYSLSFDNQFPSQLICENDSIFYLFHPFSAYYLEKMQQFIVFDIPLFLNSILNQFSALFYEECFLFNDFYQEIYLFKSKDINFTTNAKSIEDLKLQIEEENIQQIHLTSESKEFCTNSYYIEDKQSSINKNNYYIAVFSKKMSKFKQNLIFILGKDNQNRTTLYSISNSGIPVIKIDKLIHEMSFKDSHQMQLFSHFNSMIMPPSSYQSQFKMTFNSKNQNIEIKFQDGKILNQTNYCIQIQYPILQDLNAEISWPLNVKSGVLFIKQVKFYLILDKTMNFILNNESNKYYYFTPSQKSILELNLPQELFNDNFVLFLKHIYKFILLAEDGNGLKYPIAEKISMNYIYLSQSYRDMHKLGSKLYFHYLDESYKQGEINILRNNLMANNTIYFQFLYLPELKIKQEQWVQFPCQNVIIGASLEVENVLFKNYDLSKKFQKTEKIILITMSFIEFNHLFHLQFSSKLFNCSLFVTFGYPIIDYLPKENLKLISELFDQIPYFYCWKDQQDEFYMIQGRFKYSYLNNTNELEYLNSLEQQSMMSQLIFQTKPYYIPFYRSGYACFCAQAIPNEKEDFQATFSTYLENQPQPQKNIILHGLYSHFFKLQSQKYFYLTLHFPESATIYFLEAQSIQIYNNKTYSYLANGSFKLEIVGFEYSYIYAQIISQQSFVFEMYLLKLYYFQSDIEIQSYYFKAIPQQSYILKVSQLQQSDTQFQLLYWLMDSELFGKNTEFNFYSEEIYELNQQEGNQIQNSTYLFKIELNTSKSQIIFFKRGAHFPSNYFLQIYSNPHYLFVQYHREQENSVTLEKQYHSLQFDEQFIGQFLEFTNYSSKIFISQCLNDITLLYDFNDLFDYLKCLPNQSFKIAIIPQLTLNYNPQINYCLWISRNSFDSNEYKLNIQEGSNKRENFLGFSKGIEIKFNEENYQLVKIEKSNFKKQIVIIDTEVEFKNNRFTHDQCYNIYSIQYQNLSSQDLKEKGEKEKSLKYKKYVRFINNKNEMEIAQLDQTSFIQSLKLDESDYIEFVGNYQHNASYTLLLLDDEVKFFALPMDKVRLDSKSSFLILTAQESLVFIIFQDLNSLLTVEQQFEFINPVQNIFVKQLKSIPYSLTPVQINESSKIIGYIFKLKEKSAVISIQTFSLRYSNQFDYIFSQQNILEEEYFEYDYNSNSIICSLDNSIYQGQIEFNDRDILILAAFSKESIMRVIDSNLLLNYVMRTLTTHNLILFNNKKEGQATILEGQMIKRDEKLLVKSQNNLIFHNYSMYFRIFAFEQNSKGIIPISKVFQVKRRIIKTQYESWILPLFLFLSFILILLVSSKRLIKKLKIKQEIN